VPSRSASTLKTIHAQTKARQATGLTDSDTEDEEDKRISELEKKLGVDKGKRENAESDGLDGVIHALPQLIIDLLEGIGTSKRGVKRKSDFEPRNTTTKYRITQANEAEDTESGDSLEIDLDEESEFEGINDPSDSLGEATKSSSHDSQSSITSVVPTGKYIPPAARKTQPPSLPAQNQDPRLHKQVQGILNRYSPVFT
jgi:hypothetical protein